jgi:hypothetical protein
MFFLIFFLVLPVFLYCPKTPPSTPCDEKKLESPSLNPAHFTSPAAPRKPSETEAYDSTSAEGTPEAPSAKKPENTSSQEEDLEGVTSESAHGGAGSNIRPMDTEARRKPRVEIVGFPPLISPQKTLDTLLPSEEGAPTIERIFEIENKFAEGYFQRHPGYPDLCIRKHELVTDEIKRLNKKIESLTPILREGETKDLRARASDLQSYCDRLAILINPFHYGQKQGELIYHKLTKAEWPTLDRKLKEKIFELKMIVAEAEREFTDLTKERDLIYFITLKANFLSMIYENGPYLKHFNYEQAGQENGFESYHKLTQDKLLDLCKIAKEHHEKKLKLHKEGVVTKATLKHLAMAAYWTGFEKALERQMLTDLEE